MWSSLLKRLPWSDLLLFILVVVLAGELWLKGYYSGHADARRDGDVALAQLQSRFESYKRESTEQQNRALMAMVGRYNDQVAAAHRADADFQAKKAELEKENADLKQQIADVTRRWVDASGRMHPVKCVFTRGFVQQYNAALGLPDAGTAGHPDTAAATASGAGSAPRTTDAALSRLRDSGVSQADVLASVTDNARQCRVWREQVNGLLDYIEGLQP
ncbi:TPA: hypothetical protein ACIVB1_001952 [Salmonella enterica subsp. diarizonae serovar 61:l,v:z35]